MSNKNRISVVIICNAKTSLQISNILEDIFYPYKMRHNRLDCDDIYIHIGSAEDRDDRYGGNYIDYAFILDAPNSYIQRVIMGRILRSLKITSEEKEALLAFWEMYGRLPQITENLLRSELLHIKNKISMSKL